MTARARSSKDERGLACPVAPPAHGAVASSLRRKARKDTRRPHAPLEKSAPYYDSARRIRKILDTHGFQHKHLAAICGRSASCVSQWVSGHSQPNLPAVQRIAKELDLSVEWLLGGRIK